MKLNFPSKKNSLETPARSHIPVRVSSLLTSPLALLDKDSPLSRSRITSKIARLIENFFSPLPRLRKTYQASSCTRKLSTKLPLVARTSWSFSDPAAFMQASSSTRVLSSLVAHRTRAPQQAWTVLPPVLPLSMQRVAASLSGELS